MNNDIIKVKPHKHFLINILNSVRTFFLTKTVGIKLYIGDELWKRYPFSPSPLSSGLTIIQEDSEGENRMWFRRINTNSYKLQFVQMKYRDKELNEFVNNIGGI